MLNRKRRLPAAGVLVAAGALVLAGCGSSSDDSSSTSSGDPVTLTLWHGYTEADGDVLQEIVDEFNDSQDEWQVDAEAMAWDSITEKLLTSLGAGNGPNIVVNGLDTGLGYVEQGAFLSVQELYDNDEYTSTDYLYDTLVDQVTWDGEAYGAPMGTAAYSIWYNTDLWAAAGLTEADYPTTIDELIDVAKTLTVDADGDGTPESYGIALPDEDAGTLAAILHSGGGDYITDGVADLDSEENIATLEQWQSAFVDDQISPTSMDSTAAMELFGSGRAAMILNGPWEITSAASYGIDIGVMQWPSDWVQGVANYWYATSMNDTDEEMAGTLAFMDYWNQHDSQVTWTGSYYPPNRTDITADEFSDDLVATISGFSDQAHYYATGVSSNASDITAETDAMTTQIMQGGDIPTLLTETQAKVESYLGG
ncbi:MAG TPA: extracellular solute-binding protein [Cellulomonas sp.]